MLAQLSNGFEGSFRASENSPLLADRNLSFALGCQHDISEPDSEARGESVKLYAVDGGALVGPRF
jgi:hypothetical protein